MLAFIHAMTSTTRIAQCLRRGAELALVAALTLIAACGTKTPLVMPTGPATPPLFGGPPTAVKPATPAPVAPSDNNATVPPR